MKQDELKETIDNSLEGQTSFKKNVESFNKTKNSKAISDTDSLNDSIETNVDSFNQDSTNDMSFESIMEQKETHKQKQFEVRIPDLIEAGVQFGHKAAYSHPKMKKYIYSTSKTGSIINLDSTIEQLKEACLFLENQTAKGKKVLWVGTKENAKPMIKFNAENSASFYVSNRWCPGLLTNFDTLQKNLLTKQKLEKIIKNYDEFKTQNPFEKNIITKKEYIKIKKRLDKMELLYGGIKEMNRLPEIIILAENNQVVVKEANKRNIPVIKICDTNSNPEGVQFVIPGNDDSIKSLTLLLRSLFDFVVSGVSMKNQNQNINELQRKIKKVFTRK